MQQLTELLAAGATLAEAASAVGLSRTTVYTLANRLDLPRRRRAMPPAKRRKIRRLLRQGQLPLRQIARRVGVSSSTVSQMANRERDAVAGLRPRQTKGRRYCPSCHAYITLWPCVACAARAAKRRTQTLPKT